jgi:hypothetical protein
MSGIISSGAHEGSSKAAPAHAARLDPKPYGLSPVIVNITASLKGTFMQKMIY